MLRTYVGLLSAILSGFMHVSNFVTTWLIPPRDIVRRPFPLIDAVKNGDVTQVRILLAQGADPNARETQVTVRQGFWSRVVELPDGLGKTPLILAAIGGSNEIVEILLDNGAEINASYGVGVTALGCAIGGDSDEAVLRTLIERGADVNACGFETPLNAAAAGNRRRVLQILLDNGANVNGRDEEGFTALMEAAESGYIEIIDDLFSAGIDVNVRNNEGHTALYFAKERRQSAVVDLLVRAGACT